MSNLLLPLFLALLVQEPEPPKPAPQQPQSGKNIQQWAGTLRLPNGERELRLRVWPDKAAQRLQATLQSVAHGQHAEPVDAFNVDGQVISFKIARMNLEFTGEVNAAGDKVIGVLRQNGKTYQLTFAREKALQPKLAAAWHGTLRAGPRTLLLQFRVLQSEDGRTLVEFDSLNERVTGLPAEIEVRENRLRLTVPAPVSGTFEGQLDSSGARAEGFWTQGALRLPMVMTRSRTALQPPEPPRRPQTPRKPYRYREQHVTFRNETDNVTLAGTLTMPEKKGRYPVAVLISGSGAQDRDETIFNHKPFLVLADDLTESGLAVLRFDDRGTAESTGDHAAATSRDFANDVRAAVAFLRKHEEIDPRQIGLIGHSEGGLIAPMVAAADEQLAFIVLMAGPGVTGLEIMKDQARRIALAAGAAPEAVEFDARLREAVANAVLQSGKDTDTGKTIRDTIQRFVRDNTAADQPQPSEAEIKAMAGEYEVFLTPWFRFFLAYDPVPALQQVKCPVLAINGEKDVQVWHEQNLPPIAAALRSGSNRHFRAVRLPGLNHLFQHAETGAVSEYEQIEETIAVEALDLIRRWVWSVVHSPSE